eukprot:TRINITY_DN81416_c0_g1_i1.p1 TRINITY_DN81416_c0_g1~~TRINITY_DN81416_c0_g1_i1.p1  ORF type:complete len:160 (+),score=17.83 TRINITY_DN81416_c0_g1_i1:2-481(+)
MSEFKKKIKEKKMPGLLELPFNFIRVPNMKLKFSTSIFRPDAFIVFCVIVLSYFLVLSGVIYDVITETPSVGMMRDPNTGAVRPVTILGGRVNGQYIIEGLAAGFLFCLGGVGLIVLDQANKNESQHRNKIIFFGVLLAVLAYNVTIIFLKIKVPNYMY